MDMPVHIGTEMNKKGLPFVDDLNGSDLNPYKKIFLEGARIIIGHTILGRFANYGYVGEKADSEYSNLNKRNEFFATVGALPALDIRTGIMLREAGAEKSLGMIRNSSKKGKWII